jgi:hypothetical protein
MLDKILPSTAWRPNENASPEEKRWEMLGKIVYWVALSCLGLSAGLAVAAAVSAPTIAGMPITVGLGAAALGVGIIAFGLGCLTHYLCQRKVSSINIEELYNAHAEEQKSFADGLRADADLSQQSGISQSHGDVF